MAEYTPKIERGILFDGSTFTRTPMSIDTEEIAVEPLTVVRVSEPLVEGWLIP